MVPFWPDLEMTAEQIQSLYEASKPAALQPFLKTGLGRLAPEIRAIIFTNLLATPPPYGGRDFRLEQESMVTPPPISLSTFVDLKASCLAALQICRQIYREAFPVFYASKSYYLANSQDLATFLDFGDYMGVGPRLFRFDTITSLCLKGLVINKPRWEPEQVDYLVSHLHSNNREEFERERINELDCKLILADLEKMKSLRKICLCIHVGEEWEYLQFLFSIKGLGRGVINFLDSFHWRIHSQSDLGGDWKLQYSVFHGRFFMRGKDFDLLSFHDFSIQEEVLSNDFRASDLVKGDERWVEVDIGSRNYDERLPEEILSMDDGSESQDLQGEIDWDECDSETHNEPIHNPDDLQGKPNGEDENIQTYFDHGGNGAETDHQLVLQSGYVRSLADDYDQITRAEFHTNQESTTLQGTLSGDNTGASTANVLKADFGSFENPLNIEDRSSLTAIESSQRLEASFELVEGVTANLQAATSPAQIPAGLPKVDDKGDLEVKPGEKKQATKDASSEIKFEDYRDAQTQTDPVGFKYRDAQTETEPGRFSKATLTSDLGRVVQPKKPDGQKLTPHPKLKPSEEPQDSAKLQPEKGMATESLQKANGPSIPVRLSQKPSKSLEPKKQETPPAAADSSTPKTKCQSFPISNTNPHIHAFVRAAALMLAPSLFYMILYAKLESTLGQLLALLLFVLLFFVALQHMVRGRMTFGSTVKRGEAGK